MIPAIRLDVPGTSPLLKGDDTKGARVGLNTAEASFVQATYGSSGDAAS